jgi:cytochrome P450
MQKWFVFVLDQEMIFRGADTVAILMEWIMARMALHPDIQAKAQSELDAVVGTRSVADADIANLPYVQSIVKETLRMHPPGPLLSWARLAIHDAHVGGHLVPAGTTAMVNMWAIAHDPAIWAEPEEFRPERFQEEEDVSDLRLAPFGAGRRVCPGKMLALATTHLWVAQLLHRFEWTPAAAGGGVDLSERLNMSLEMATPLVCKAVPRSQQA